MSKTRLLVKKFTGELLGSLHSQMSALAATYSLGVDVFLLLHFAVGESWGIVAALNHAAFWLCLGNCFSLLLARISPYPRLWTLYSLPGAVFFVIWYGGLVIPTNAPNEHDFPLSISVATYNMSMTTGTITEKLSVIEAMNADIIGIQEMSPDATFSDALHSQYKYNYTSYGLGFFSNFPIDERQSAVLTVRNEKNWDVPTVLRTTVDVQGHPITVYVALFKRPTLQLRPLKYDDQPRRQGVQIFLEDLAQQVNPVLLLCDCNMTDQTQDYGHLSNRLFDGWMEQGWGLGFTAPDNSNSTALLLARGDMIWHSNGITILHIGVWEKSGSSDHRPVFARLGIDS